MLGSVGSCNSQFNQLCLHVLQAGFPVSLLFLTPASFSLQTGTMAAYHATACIAASPHGYLPFKPHGCIFLSPMVDQLSSLSSCPYFKCWPGTSYVTSYPAPPTMGYFCQLPCIFTFIWLPSLVRVRVTQWCRGLHLPWLRHQSGHILKVTYTYTFCPGW